MRESKSNTTNRLNATKALSNTIFNISKIHILFSLVSTYFLLYRTERKKSIAYAILRKKTPVVISGVAIEIATPQLYLPYCK